MKLTTDALIELFNKHDISCRADNGHVVLSGDNAALVKALADMLNNNRDVETKLFQRLTGGTAMSAKEFLLACESAGITVNASYCFGAELTLTGGKPERLLKLENSLAQDVKLKASVILIKCASDKNAMDAIKERASIRYADGYSDTLLSAVLSSLIDTGETIERDKNGEIVLKQKTDWTRELLNLSK